MTIIAQKIADKLILRPTRHPLNAVGKERQLVPFRKGSLEVWTQRVGTHHLDEVDLFVLKFQGTAGRAERATYHPMDCWADLRAELWAVNPPGYGGSTGPASVKTLAEAARTVYLEAARLAQGRPIVVMGNSLGTTVAMHLAANFPIAGLILRNPPPLRHLIVGRYGWWNLWLGAMLIAQKVPRQLCCVRNARQIRCPAVFISSRKDQTVPANYQDKVFQNFAAPHRLLQLTNADHATSLNLDEQREYRQHLEWLREAALLTPNVSPAESTTKYSTSLGHSTKYRLPANVGAGQRS
ncbi:MAG: alpha/beta fold hydrolase [Planctomycetales bacterium]|nr:alpha/beta fold hydrolase [Planctomycetales bacterium]